MHTILSERPSIHLLFSTLIIGCYDNPIPGPAARTVVRDLHASAVSLGGDGEAKGLKYNVPIHLIMLWCLTWSWTTMRVDNNNVRILLRQHHRERGPSGAASAASDERADRAESNLSILTKIVKSQVCLCTLPQPFV